MAGKPISFLDDGYRKDNITAWSTCTLFRFGDVRLYFREEMIAIYDYVLVFDEEYYCEHCKHYRPLYLRLEQTTTAYL